MKCLPAALAASAIALFAGPAAAGPAAMTPEEARHLIGRTGFGASPQEIKALTGKSYAEGVAAILGTLSPDPSIPMPDWVNAPDYPAEYIWTLGQTADELFFANRWMEIEELSGWWMSEMVATPSPLTERLTLFWHDHFATSYEGVENPQWMGRQNQFFRANAAGNFSDLAHGILQDPAMLVYLSNTENFADSPNENLGREFLELFTLGEGRGYTQADVEAAARALTGHSIAELSAPVYAFYPNDHDPGMKTLLGQTGRLGAADVARIALAHPEFGPYIVEKLWKTFISDQPDPAEVSRLSAIWRENHLELEPLLREMFLSGAFWAPENRGRLIKSPVELIVSTLRSLGTPVENSTGLAWLSHDMGQALFFPPNVGGWPQGVSWLNDASATARATTLSYFAFGDLDDEAVSAPMMTSGNSLAGPLAATTDGLRVGQVFAIEVEQSAVGTGGLFILYDVSFEGHTWRSLPVWIEVNTEEDYAGYGILKADCRPRCFREIEGEDGWVWYSPWEGAREEDLTGASREDIALLQAIAAHLPTLIGTTAQQVIWQAEAEEESYTIPSIDKVVAIAEDLGRDSETAIGPTDTELVQGLRAPGILGLQGYAAVRDLDDIDSYLEAAEQARIRPAIPSVIYEEAGAWLADLPAGGLDSKRAAAALLSVPRQSRGQREELIAQDVDALIRALILSPEYQVN
ncbi:DUF1800 domain-containing protein [Yoonia sp. GPGPB17]|uniref:DUF1800 domain-containing protein n=1 Tax=Yoonia sp. GPGPB17 TaxID=3026147 RepID=UPI0030BF6666